MGKFRFIGNHESSGVASVSRIKFIPLSSEIRFPPAAIDSRHSLKAHRIRQSICVRRGSHIRDILVELMSTSERGQIQILTGFASLPAEPQTESRSRTTVGCTTNTDRRMLFVKYGIRADLFWGFDAGAPNQMRPIELNQITSLQWDHVPPDFALCAIDRCRDVLEHGTTGPMDRCRCIEIQCGVQKLLSIFSQRLMARVLWNSEFPQHSSPTSGYLLQDS